MLPSVDSPLSCQSQSHHSRPMQPSPLAPFTSQQSQIRISLAAICPRQLTRDHSPKEQCSSIYPRLLHELGHHAARCQVAHGHLQSPVRALASVCMFKYTDWSRKRLPTPCTFHPNSLISWNAILVSAILDMNQTSE
jgi:hypothetical protein